MLLPYITIISTFIGVVICVPYDSHLKLGDVKINLPKNPPKNHRLKALYADAKIFARRYERKIQDMRNHHNYYQKKTRSAHLEKKFEKDFNKDLKHLKLRLKQANSDLALNDATLFQLVTEFIKKLSMISLNTHCFIYGCPFTQPSPPSPGPPSSSSSSSSEQPDTTEETTDYPDPSTTNEDE